MSFTEWLYDQQYRDDPIGDLARDVIMDRNWPSDGDLRSYTDYIDQNSTIDSALKAVKKAWV